MLNDEEKLGAGDYYILGLNRISLSLVSPYTVTGSVSEFWSLLLKLPWRKGACECRGRRLGVTARKSSSVVLQATRMVKTRVKACACTTFEAQPVTNNTSASSTLMYQAPKFETARLPSQHQAHVHSTTADQVRGVVDYKSVQEQVFGIVADLTTRVTNLTLFLVLP